MLTSLVIKLQATAGATLPATLGRAGQALLLDLIRQRDPGLTETLHQNEGPKPYTVSNLVLGQRQDGSLRVQAGQEGWLRFTGLDKAISRHLYVLAANPPDSIELTGRRLRVTGATLDPAEHAWAGQISYQELVTQFWANGRANSAATIGLEFASPTTFKSKGRYVPLPLPELVFGSLLSRWETFAPIDLNLPVRDLAEEAVVLSRYELSTCGLPYKQGGIQIGFTGQVTFSILDHDPHWLKMLHLLAAFAFYSGVGYQTTAGLGQVRPGG